MSGTAQALDLGSKTARWLELKDGKRGLQLTGFAAGPKDSADLGRASGPAVLGLSGRSMTLRYSQVPPSPDWQLQNLMELEIEDLSGQTGGALSADYNLLPIEDEQGGMDTILLAFARDDALDEGSQSALGLGVKTRHHVPRCVALFNAFLRCGSAEEDGVVALVDIGHETIDLAIARGTDLLCVRNLSQGGKVFDDAIAQAFSVKDRKAEQLKRELLDLDPASRGRYASGQSEKVTVAAGGAGSLIVSAIQSSLAFSRKQTGDATLQFDKVLISGGSSRLRGLKGMLREALRVPVEVFDPFEAVDTSALDGEAHNQLEVFRNEAVVALGLAITAIDDDAYQLSILPEAQRKKQRFMQRTVFNLAAGLIGVVLLVLAAIDGQALSEKAESASRRLRSRKNSIDRVSREAEEEIEQVSTLGDQLVSLASQSLPRDAAIAVLEGLWKVKPPEFWIESMRVQQKAMEGRRSEEETVVVLEGRGKDLSGTGPPYSRFLRDFKAEGFEVVAKTSESGGERRFTWTVRFPPETAAPIEEEE
ncbi:MAG: pilus assembly protein PilM [Planctomycetota bacterium]